MPTNLALPNFLPIYPATHVLFSFHPYGETNLFLLSFLPDGVHLIPDAGKQLSLLAHVELQIVPQRLKVVNLVPDFIKNNILILSKQAESTGEYILT